MQIRDALLVASSLLAVSAAADSSVERQAAEMFRTVMSPFCEGETLATCADDPSRALRHEIADSLEQGVPSGEIRKKLEQSYGAAVLGTPRNALLLWGVPVVWIGGCFATFLCMIKNRKGMSTASGADER